MVQSSEYPDLRWIPPKSWRNANRSSVQVIIIHDTEGSEVADSAENGALYDQRRTDGTSTHFFHDQNSTVQCVLTADIAYAARTQGNLRGIQHELCGRADQGVAGWADSASKGTLRQAARQVARDCKKWDIPVRRLTPAQVASGMKGICGHADITKAFPQDNGSHTDPGPTFPWTSFITMVKAEMTGEPEVALADETIVIGSSAKPIFGDRASAPASEWLSLATIYAYRSNLNVATTAAADAARDAQIAATLAQMQAILTAMSETTGAFTPEQLEALKTTMADAATEAGQAATARLEEGLNSLREHLGDEPAAPTP